MFFPVTLFVGAKKRSTLNRHLLRPTPGVSVRPDELIERCKRLRAIGISKDLFDLAKNMSPYLLDVVNSDSIAGNPGQPDKLSRKMRRIFKENLGLNACSP